MGPAERVPGPLTHRGSALRVLSAVAAVSAGVLLVGIIWVSRPAAAPGDDPGEVTRVGVVQGQDVGGYLASSRDELDRLTDPAAPAAGDTWALVSLESYVAPGSLPVLLAGTAVAQVYTRVPLTGAHTPVIRIPVYHLPADVLSGMLDAALDRDREQATYLQLSERVGAGQERVRQAYEVAAGTASAEAAAYRSGCSCAFAAVVHAEPGALRGVAGRAGVRAVDPAPEMRRLDRTEFRPLLPEQLGTVPVEPSRPVPVPNEGSPIAPPAPTPILSSLKAPVRSTSPGRSERATIPSAPAPEERPAVPSAADATTAHDPPSTSAAP